jgi:4'-phosphopantetheinyl transferase
LDFNNSHEGPFVLLGVARGITAELGVDVMLPPEDPVELQDSLDLQLTPMEKHHLAIPLPPRERAARLTTLWTIKEGYTKAIGHGVGFGLERIEVELGHMGEVWAVHVDGRPVGVEGWKVLSGMIRQPSEESEEGGSGSVDGSRGSGGSGLGKEGLGEGKVNTQRGEVGWAVIWRGDEWDGEVEMVKWGEFVRVFEERGKKS